MIAHSFGGAATTIALARGLAAGRVGYVAPLFSLRDTVDRFARFTGLEGEARATFDDGLAAANLASTPTVDGPALAPRLTVPALVVHDAADREVPYADATALVAAWPGARLVTTTGLGHRRILTDPEVIAAVTGFVTGGAPARALLDEGTRLERELSDREGRRARAFP